MSRSAIKIWPFAFILIKVFINDSQVDGKAQSSYPFGQQHHTIQQVSTSPVRQFGHSIPFLPFPFGPYIHQTSSGFHHSIIIVPGQSSGGFPMGPLSQPQGAVGPFDMGHNAHNVGSTHIGHGLNPVQSYPYIPPQSYPQQSFGSPFQFRESQCTHFRDSGVCYRSNVCSSRGGRPTTYCRDISKFCCLFFLTCASSTSEETSYFRNPNWPLTERITDSCRLTVKKSGSNICYVRVTPDSLRLPASTGYCDGISMNAEVAGKQYEPMCGDLSQKSFDVDISSGQSMELSINARQGLTLMWKIKIDQIPCSESSGSKWPTAGGSPYQPSQPIPPQMSPTEAPTPPEEVAAPGFAPASASAPGHKTILKCGVSYQRSNTNVRDMGQVSVRNEQVLHPVGWRNQLPLREDDEEEECEDESSQRCLTTTNENPLLHSLAWGVPEVKESLLYQHSGNRLPITTRITFGTETLPHEYPWQIAMFKNGRYHCGASLISDRHVLTAAHCVKKYTRRPSVINLSIGDWNINSASDGPNVMRKISKIVTHPGYSTVTLKYDVAVLTLAEKVPLSDTLRHVCLPSKDENIEGKIITVIGWGRDQKNRLQSKLMQHSAGVVSNSECNTKWEKTGAPLGLIVDEMICMNPQYGDSCKGDSGGPAILEDPPNSKRYTQVGIVSFGSASCTDKNLPGVYTKVSKVVNWIREQMV